MATASLARTTTAATASFGGGYKADAEPGRGCRAAGTSCSGCGARRGSASVEFAGVGKLGIGRINFGMRPWQWSGGAAGARIRGAPSHCREGRHKGPVWLMRGVNGAFWEGADSSESPANLHFTSEDETPDEERSVLWSLIREIEPLDISLISKDATADSTSAMKRTISGMLGLLPSDQFQVTIETPSDHLARLLVSSMMTGYTLRNAEYRLCLQRNLDLSADDMNNMGGLNRHGTGGRGKDARQVDERVVVPVIEHHEPTNATTEKLTLPDALGDMTPEAAKYIQQLQAKLLAASRELKECKNALSSLALLRQEKNDLLDYLRSLNPEKVAELSQPSPEVQEAVEQVVAELLGTMSGPKVAPFETSTLASSWDKGVPPDVIGNIPLQSKASVTLTTSRDYLARLLFWCTLLGYHMRGLEYRLELCRTLSFSGEDVLEVKDNTSDEVQ